MIWGRREFQQQRARGKLAAGGRCGPWSLWQARTKKGAWRGESQGSQPVASIIHDVHQGGPWNGAPQVKPETNQCRTNGQHRPGIPMIYAIRTLSPRMARRLPQPATPPQHRRPRRLSPKGLDTQGAPPTRATASN